MPESGAAQLALALIGIGCIFFLLWIAYAVIRAGVRDGILEADERRKRIPKPSTTGRAAADALASMHREP